jgi:hypothetical protein
MTRVTISTITERGVFPQFYGEFKHPYEVENYVFMWRRLAAESGALIRIDKTFI